jgi:DNA-binding LacI/PurR family transcriptional regulator
MKKKAEPAPASGAVARKHHLISARLRERILQGEYDEQIPGQRVLAEEFGVNFLTVRKAVNTLVKDGLLTKHPGKGTFVTRLKREQTFNIAAVLGGLSFGFGGHHSKLIQGIQEEAARHDYDLIYRPHLGDPQVEQQAIEDILARKKCDGVLVWPTRREASQAVPLLQRNGIPFVVVMRVDPESRDKVNYVIDDDVEGGYLATKHLLDLGHRKIGFVARAPREGQGEIFEEERWLGFVKAHKEAGLKPGPWLQADWLTGSESDRKPVSRKFLGRLEGLSGLFCVTDRLALHVLGMARTAGRVVPDDLAIVGYDDLDAASLFDLTTIHQPLEEIGAEAVRVLLQEIDGEGRALARKKLVPRLVVRGSTQAVT